MPAESLSDAALILYGLPLDEFVEARNAMEKEIRKAGNRELANQIKALRKPSVVAAGLNAMVRSDPDAVEDLLRAVADLRDAQERIAAGRESDFAVLQDRYRQATRALVDLTDKSRRVETQSALEAAAIDPAFHDMLRTGTFAAAPKPTGTFGVSLPVANSIARADRPADKPRAAPNPPAPAAPNLRLVRAATTKAEAARDRKIAAERALAEARETLRILDERLATLEADMARTRREGRKAQEAVRAAEKRVARSAEAVARAEEALAVWA